MNKSMLFHYAVIIYIAMIINENYNSNMYCCMISKKKTDKIIHPNIVKY